MRPFGAERRSWVEIQRLSAELDYTGVAAIHKILTSEIDPKYGVDIHYCYGACGVLNINLRTITMEGFVLFVVPLYGVKVQMYHWLVSCFLCSVCQSCSESYLTSGISELKNLVLEIPIGGPLIIDFK